MADSRLVKLGVLLESRNRALRAEAISTLAQLATTPHQQQICAEKQLFAIIGQYLRSPVWEGRSATAELLNTVLSDAAIKFQREIRELARAEKAQKKYSQQLEDCARQIDSMNPEEILDRFQVLVSCEESSQSQPAADGNTQNPSTALRHQRKLVDQHLDLDSSTGVSSKSFITDDELSFSLPVTSRSTWNNNDNSLPSADKVEVKMEPLNDGTSGEDPIFTPTPADASRLSIDSLESVKMEQNADFIEFFRFITKDFILKRLAQDLVESKWHIRHGAALALARVCVQADIWLLLDPRLLSPVALRLLQLLCLDRFCDFVTGGNAIAPVREAAAQALCALMLKLGESGEGLQQGIASAILGRLCVLVQMRKEQQWQCRQTALLVAKYHFSLSQLKFPGEIALFQATLFAMEYDPVDECVSSATQALCSLFANFRLTEKGALIDQAMVRLWALLECSQRLVQLREGVDSILVDLLDLLVFWLRSSSDEQPLKTLSGPRLFLIIFLLDCTAQHCPVNRAAKAMDCICTVLDNQKRLKVIPTDWTGQIFFHLLRRLYRCVLFCPPSASCQLLPLCQRTLDSLLNLMDMGAIDKAEKSTLISAGLMQSIGFWLSVLIYDHRNAEIDVFLHCIDGPASTRESPKEMFCSDEIRFFKHPQIDEVLLERKLFAARWLASLVDLLFHWDGTLDLHQHQQAAHQQQPMSVSVQLLFLPYLRSNSLYQKLGAILVAHAWAVYQYNRRPNGDHKLAGDEKQANGQVQQVDGPVPAILANEILQLLVSAPQNRLYDEVAHLVNVLSNECNEFQHYCVRKGVPMEEILPLNQVNSMEDVVLSTFKCCDRRLQKQEDKQALSARYAYIIELIESTKLGIRTYSNRINSLLSSTLFHFANKVPLPTQLTPLIRPLMDALESETNFTLADSILARTLTTLIELTAQRIPCPHGKILRQLGIGLAQCDLHVPKPQQWASPDSQLRVISLDRIDGSYKIGTKTKNCALALQRICQHFGSFLPKLCPEMIGERCSLDDETEQKEKEMESFLLRAEFLRIVLPALKDVEMRREIIRSRVTPRMDKLADFLAHPNPAVRFRVARLLSDLTATELCPMLALVYSPMERMLSGSSSQSPFARCGAIELLTRLSQLGEQRLLGAVSLLTLLSLRAIGDQLETVRTAAAFSLRQLVPLLPLENLQKHFLAELSVFADDHLANTYRNSFSLVDVLGSPGNLPKVCQSEIPWLREDVKLRDYQLEGITWLSFLHKFGLNGILADDMGLGKTLQLLTLIAWDYSQQVSLAEPAEGSSPASLVRNQSDSDQRTHYWLVVCPRTLVDHWCKEWRSFFPNSPIIVLKLPEWQELKLAVPFALLVVSYEELRGSRPLRESHWRYVVLDEGHCIRNPSSQLFDAVCSLSSAHRLILSGTPVQNSPADLWALFTFLMPGYLASKTEFHAKFMRQILGCRNPKATEQQIKEGEQALQQLHRQCLPFVMRRLKSEVLAELPDKIVQDRECELSPLQRQIYAELVDRCSLMKRGKATKMKEEAKGTEGEGERDWLSPLQLLHALRKLVDHPWLVCAQMTAGQLAAHGLTNPGQLSVEQSGKMLALRELLAECQIGDRGTAGQGTGKATGGRRECEAARDGDKPQGQNTPPAHPTDSTEPDSSPGPSGGTSASSSAGGSAAALPIFIAPHRALVFCQWRATVELIAAFLDRGAFGPEVSYLRLDGSVPVHERQAVVDRFNEDPSVDLLLLTTHIGGVGLNLTGADVVVFVDHDWNPFRDLQAIDRAHRLGQTRTVNVYRLVTRGTLEEKVMRLQRFKQDTANALVGADNRSLASMGTDELLELFSLGDGGAKAVPSGTKKAKMERTDVNSQGERWELDGLWGEGEDEADLVLGQYAEQHSVHSFLHSTAMGGPPQPR